MLLLTLFTTFTDRIRESGNAIVSVWLSVRFHSTFGTDWLLTSNVSVWLGHGHSSQGIDHWRSRSRARLMWSVWPRSRAVCSLVIRAISQRPPLCTTQINNGRDAARRAGPSVAAKTCLIVTRPADENSQSNWQVYFKTMHNNIKYYDYSDDMNFYTKINSIFILHL